MRLKLQNLNSDNPDEYWNFFETFKPKASK